MLVAAKPNSGKKLSVLARYQPGDPFIERIIQEALKFDHIVIDAFCGFGGTSEGFWRTGKYKVIACINHWDKAIRTHNKRYPNCLHIEEDFKTADLHLIHYMVNKIRILKPSIQVHGWFSLECTNFSNAKGGMARDADSRTLAEHMDRYVKIFNFDCIWIENVREFLLWGPMIPKITYNYKGKTKTYHFNPGTDDHTIFEHMPGASCPLHIKKKKGKVEWFGAWMIPDPKRKAEDFNRWNSSIEQFGYKSEHRLLNAADYGVPQHRIRLFMQFNRPGVRVAWPIPTHDKKGAHGRELWNPIKPCLDLQDEGTELLSFDYDKKGNRKPRIESPETIKRLINGCDTQIFKRKRKKADKIRIIDYYFGNGYTKGEDEISGAMRTKDPASVNTVQFVSEFRNNGEASGLDKPSKAAMTKDKLSLDTIQYISKSYSGDPDSKNVPVDKPSGAMTGKGGNAAIITSEFIDQRYSSGQQNKSIDEPSGALTSNPKQVVMNFDRFIMDTQFNNESASVDNTSRTITANRKHYYIINAGWFEGHAHAITQPSSTIIARQDKMPQYLIVLETGELAIEIYDYDPPHYVAMKRYMAENGIISIKMRMLKDTEMLQIQDLPKDYPLTSSATDNKKMIGNAVPPALVVALANTWDNNWREYKIAA